MRRHTRTARFGAYVASGALALTGLTLVSAPAEAAPDPVAKEAAAGWLEDELVGGLIPDGFGGTDYGLSLDTAYSLQAVGGYGSTVTEIADAMQSSGTAYLEPSYSFNGNYVGQSAGATAKVMALFESLSPARDTVGTIDLQDRLEDLTTPSGRIADMWTKDGAPNDQDFTTTLSQAFAARALTAAGSTEADEARAFLLQQQCGAGFFRLTFSAADPVCAGGSEPNLDATALAVIQLSAISSPPAEVTSAISKARQWLASVQNCDGSFGSGADGRNANSTGLASTALTGSVAARQAAIWLNGRQAKSSDGALASEVGVVSLNDADYAAGRANGIPPGDRYKWRRATAQAAPGLADFSTDPTPAIRMNAVSGYHKAGTRLAFRVTGAEAGTVVCLGASRAIASASGATVVATLPAGTARRLIRARDGYGNTAGSYVKVLGTKWLTTTPSKSRVKRNGTLSVVLSGLAPGERARIMYAGALKKQGVAGPGGRLFATFAVGASTGRKLVAGYGQFPAIRRDFAYVTVVR